MSVIKEVARTILYKPLFNALIFFVWLIPGNNVGVAIIILTILVRLLLWPSSLNALKEQKKMKDIQPRLEEIKEKFKDDKEKQARATMEFYRSSGVNPFGSCLPLLIQLPILIILYYVFQAGMDTSRFNNLYSFTPRPDFINTHFFFIDLAKPDRYLLPYLAGIAQFVQSWQMTKLQSQPDKKKEETSQQDAFQKAMSSQMLYMMPFFTVLISWSLPAALPLYWVVTTLFAIFQQWWFFKKHPISQSILATSAAGVEVTVRKKE